MVELNHEYVKLFNKTDEYRKNYPGIHYLLYSTFLPKNEKIAYPPGSLFELAFSFSHLQDYTEIIKAFTALLFFGAFGTRSRRGAGTFRVKKLKINSPDLNHKQAFAIYKNALSITTPQQLNEQYTEIQNFLASTASNDYSTLKDGTLYIFDPKNSWKESLDLIGREFKNFRGIKQSEIEKTPNFGFPIVHRNSKTTMQAGNNKAEKITRRSSPLLFRVAKTTDDKFFPMIIWLRGDLLPLGYEIMDTKAEHKAQPNPQIIQDFISTLSPACTVKL
jgi:CRISPR-associated protein Cmr1